MDNLPSESTTELSRSPNKQITDSEQLPAKLRQLAGLNRKGTTKLFTPAQLYNKATEYFEHCIQNPIQSNQLITAGQKGGEVVQIARTRMYTMQGLALSLGVNTQYISDLIEQLKDKDDEISIQYSLVIAYIKDTISMQRIENAAVREFDAMFVAKLEGIKDQVEHSGEVKQTYTAIVFQTRNVEDIQAEVIPNDAQSLLESL